MIRSIAVATVVAGAAAQRCLGTGGWRNESYVFNTPTNGGPNFGPACQAWQGSSCCTPLYTDILSNQGVSALYPGYSWDHCSAKTGRNMSSRCLQFMQWEECFYSCDPWSGYFEDPNNPGQVVGIPMCETMCDDWYDACKDDYACVTDWYNFPFNQTSGQYYCADDCTKMGQRYSSGADMCNKMWNTSMFASRNMDSCYSMYFWGNHNPNRYAAMGGGSSGVAAPGITPISIVIGVVITAVASVMAVLSV